MDNTTMLLMENPTFRKGYEKGRADAIEELVTKVCEKFTEYERKGWFEHTNVNIKNKVAELGEQLKEQSNEI